MTIKTPSAQQITDAGAQLGISLSEHDALEYIECMAPLIEGYNTVDSMPDNLPPVKYPRTPGYRPEGDENRHNAWYYKTSIEGASEGRIAGQRVAIKDNICVAGVPMMNGASVLEGYVPDVDATVVTRILDAGGEIAGKAHCEYPCFSGGSHPNATGQPVQNPWKEGHTTGGSSSGCAALVAAGEVAMALGCDQAGSVRIPSSYSGICGMKPTHGLVPYTAIMPIEMTLDHCGPMTDTVSITYRPPRMMRSNWVLVSSANAASAPPTAWDPVSPMKIWAGAAFHHRKASTAPTSAAPNRPRSSAPFGSTP